MDEDEVEGQRALRKAEKKARKLSAKLLAAAAEAPAAAAAVVKKSADKGKGKELAVRPLPSLDCLASSDGKSVQLDSSLAEASMDDILAALQKPSRSSTLGAALKAHGASIPEKKDAGAKLAPAKAKGAKKVVEKEAPIDFASLGAKDLLSSQWLPLQRIKELAEEHSKFPLFLFRVVANDLNRLRVQEGQVQRQRRRTPQPNPHQLRLGPRPLSRRARSRYLHQRSHLPFLPPRLLPVLAHHRECARRTPGSRGVQPRSAAVCSYARYGGVDRGGGREGLEGGQGARDGVGEDCGGCREERGGLQGSVEEPFGSQEGGWAGGQEGQVGYGGDGDARRSGREGGAAVDDGGGDCADEVEASVQDQVVSLAFLERRMTS